MRTLTLLVATAAFVAQTASAGQSPNHPEATYPDDIPVLTSPGGPYTDFFRAIQQKLHEAGFDAGPVNGNFGIKTQAALAQYQLSQNLPASGMTDEETLKALGVQRPSLQ
jgi:peptidoglycan hydrolase-like protein with peptidoglycan-binding domain